MARKIVTPVEVQASVTGDQSVKSFRAQLKEAQQEAFRLAQALGQTSPEAVKAAQKVAELRDQMDDFNATVKGLHPDRFQKFANITATLANGFAAAQGAAALLGSESEDLQKSMARVQGAMAFAQGISGLKDMKFQLGDIRGFITKQIIPAFTTLAGAARAVGAALGIGAIIAGVTALIAAFKNLDISINGVSRSDAKLLDQQEKRLKASQDNVEALDAQDNILKLQGKSERDILKLKIAALQTAIDNQRAVIDTSKAQAQAQIAAAKRNKDILTGILNFISAPFQLLMDGIDAIAKKLGYDTGLGKTFQDLKASAANLVFDPAETEKEANETIKEQEKSYLQMRNTLAGHKLALRELDRQDAEDRRKDAEDEAKRLKDAEDQKAKDAEDAAKKKADALKEIQQQEIAFKKQLAEADEALLREQEERDKRRLELDEQFAKARAAAADAYFDALKARLKAQEDLKQSIEDNAIASAQALISILGEQSKVGKAIALAQVAYDTGKAISGALAVTQSASQDNVATGGLAGIAKFVAISAAILTNSARAIRIIKYGTVQQGGGGNLAGMNGGRGVPQPSFASSTLGGGTQFAGSFDNKVYVTEGDITGTQRRVRQNRGVSVI